MVATSRLLRGRSSGLIVALGREGKQAVAIDAERYPHTPAMDVRQVDRWAVASFVIDTIPAEALGDEWCAAS